MSLMAPAVAGRRHRQGSFRVTTGRVARDGSPEPRVFAVPANTLVVADTFGFHARGPSSGQVAAGRGLGLWPAQPVPALGRARPVERRRAWRAAACSAGGSAVSLERGGLKPHRWRARLGVSAFDPPESSGAGWRGTPPNTSNLPGRGCGRRSTYCSGSTPRRRASVYDLGAGAGNVTRLIAARWPDARTVGDRLLGRDAGQGRGRKPDHRMASRRIW